MNPDVDEGTEARHVGDRTLQHHAGHEIVDFLDALLEGGGLECGARIATRFLELAQDIGYGRQPERVVDEGLWRERTQDCGISYQVFNVALRRLDDAPHQRIGFRMNARSIEGV